ncbi:MAG TPA: polyketide synthase, partial [Myxococcota bacterium]|nr:polyketide synthase [Myxococcota bacterium]
MPNHPPLAILGASCRLPGGARDLDSLWDLLASGRDAITEIPADRFDVEALYDPDPDAPGRTWSRWMGALDHLWDFDPSFFGLSPREATAMDPQQRMLLEVAWEALEAAGIPPGALRGSRTGVFVGTNTNDFPLVRNRDPSTIDAFTAAGMHTAVLANRIAHALDLRGPNLSLDTACAAGLTAIHLAAASVRSGECELALAGGVNLCLHEIGFMGTTKARMLSPTGRPRVFDHRADGYVRGEGCGLVAIASL